MIAETARNDIQSLSIKAFMGEETMKKLRGKVYHDKRICSYCREGNKAEILHPHHFIQVCLPYLRKKPFKIYGKEKGRPFENGLRAYDFLDEIQEEIKEKVFIPWAYREQSGSLCNFGNFFQKFKAEKYPGLQSYLKPLWDYDLKDINRIVLKQFYRNLPKNIKTSSRNLVLRVVRSVLSEAFQEGLIKFLPAFPRKDKPEKPVKNWLTWEDQLKIIEETPKQLKPIFLFLACHGKRISEALSLKYENIDFKRRTCRLYQSKILREQELPLHDEFLKILPIAIHKTGYVFQQYTIQYLNQALKETCIKAGFKPVTTHEFGRHSFISQGKALGYTNEQLALVTENLSSMSAYSHMDLELKRKIINRAL
ncbi:MAG TPA: hypothetical protein DCY12_10675 [Candidatus Atribacteria bacterium]|nr:hypothetical protein [Candidatus Atribacteria bacterium]